jgi:hypothetical protein
VGANRVTSVTVALNAGTRPDALATLAKEVRLLEMSACRG